MRVLIVAAENDALVGMKVGGVADVVRDAPRALHKLGHEVDVVAPAYGLPGQLQQAELLGSVEVPFSGNLETVSVYQVTQDNQLTQSDAGQGARQLLLHHPLFAAAGNGKIYCDDPDDRPFATDASKFALFSAAVVECLMHGLIDRPDVLHLNDWHTALVAVLIQFNPDYQSLQSLRTVFTIHNLALQGTRPLRDDSSAFESWYPHIVYDGQMICDPKVWHCINPMRAGINLADKVHVVSPRYAEEILQPSDHSRGFFGGEGLEQDLRRANQQGRLVGILNGCEYPDETPDDVSMEDFYQAADSALLQSIGRQRVLKSADYLAQRRLQEWSQPQEAILKESSPKPKSPKQSSSKQSALKQAAAKQASTKRLSTKQAQQASGPLVVSIGRLTDQKVLLLRQPWQGTTVLAELLKRLAEQQGRLIILGSGNESIEQEFVQVAGSHNNFLFLNIYGEALSAQLYHLGDFFLMPSSFEPCGISQMLAMRAGQPCVAHAVGGLDNTIIDGKNGFTFGGDNLFEQSAGLLETFDKALELCLNQPKKWQAIAKAAVKSRFEWSASAGEYVDRLYLG